MKYLLLALFIPSLSFGTPVRQTGVSGVNMTGYVVVASSEPAADIDVSSTVYTGISTVTVSNRGGRPALIVTNGVFNNTSGASKTYNCGVYQNGVQLSAAALIAIVPNGFTLPWTRPEYIASTPAGATNYVVNCKSSASNTGQVIQSMEIDAYEF